MQHTVPLQMSKQNFLQTNNPLMSCLMARMKTVHPPIIIVVVVVVVIFLLLLLLYTTIIGVV